VTIPQPLLETAGLTACYGPVEALKPTSIGVAEGELVAVLGANGAGKSTLLRSIMGLGRAAGTVRFAGAVVSGLPTQRLAALGMIMVPEGRGIFGPLSVRENLDLGAFLPRLKASKQELQRDLDRVFGLFPRLQQRQSQTAQSLSGGEQQMLAIGRALMARPRLLLLDEPSLGLAPRLAGEILEVLGELNRQGLSILLVEQKAPLALRLAHRAYVLANGAVVSEATPEALSSSRELARIYLG
jgi:branched-chain amino acid transport system ATP-binding protein